MRTGRLEYDRDLSSDIIPDEEPVFILRGQDVCAAATVLFYASMAEINGASPELVKRCREHAQAMARWNAKKVPDLADWTATNPPKIEGPTGG